MLTDDDKQRIRDEEIFRAEVLKELSVPRNNVLQFLNSSLGIWLLSTLVLGTFGWSYSLFQASRQNDEAILRLDTEIDARLEAVDSQLEILISHNQGASKELILQLLAAPANERVIQNEFSGRNFRSLLYELHGRVSPRDGYFVKLAIETLKSIESEYLNKELNAVDTIQLYQKVSYIRTVRWGSGDMFLRQTSYDNFIIWAVIGVMWGVIFLTLLVAFVVTKRNIKPWRFP